MAGSLKATVLLTEAARLASLLVEENMQPAEAWRAVHPARRDAPPPPSEWYGANRTTNWPIETTGGSVERIRWHEAPPL